MSEQDNFELQDFEAAQEFLNQFPAVSRNRGKVLFSTGAVRQLRCENPGLRFVAQVQANKVFRVALYYEDDTWDADCNCPEEFDCPHCYAAMLGLEAKHKEQSGPPIPNPGSVLEQELARELKRKLRSDERHFVKQLQDLYLRSRGKNGIETWQLDQLGFYSFGLGWGRLELWSFPPRNDYEFWLYLAHTLLDRKLSIPDFLRPITNFEPIAGHLAEQKRRKAIEHWTERLGKFRSASPQRRRNRTVDLRLVLAPEAAHLEWKPTDADGFKRVRTSTAKRLNDEYLEGILEIVPEAAPLYPLLQKPFNPYRTKHEQLSYDEADGRRQLNPLLRLPGLQTRVVSQSGELLPRISEPLRWQLIPAETEQDDYKLQLVRSDGTAPPAIWFSLPGEPALYVAADGIYPGPPVSEDALDITEVNAIPAPALETPEGVELIVGLGLDLPARMAHRVKRVCFKPKIICEIKATLQGGGSESLCVRVLAEAEESREHEIFTAGGWESDGAPVVAAQKTDKVLCFHDRTALQVFPEVLEALGLKWEEYQQHWRARLTRDLPHKFVNWLQSLPKEIEVHLDSELTSLTKDPTQASVRLDCTEAGVDWFDLKVVLSVSDTELTAEELKALLDARGRFVRLGKKGWRRLQFNLSPEEDERLARLGLSPQDFSSEPQRLHALQLADSASAQLLPEHQAAQIQRRIEELKTRVTPPLPGNVRADLRPYQVQGFHFLAYLTENRFGGILADDMGLGKTLQALTWLAWMRMQPGFSKKPTLVVCPKSVMDTWRGEAERFTPDLRVKLWKGTDGAGLRTAAAETDLLVMNYAQLRGLDPAIGSVDWLAAILDEGQYIKNPESQTARAARSLKADYRLALSGTPIENRLLDLWSLMTFAMPGVLGNRAQFLKRFDHSNDPMARRRLTARVRPFLLRRTKAQVAADLPDRIEEELYCELEGDQKTLYQAEFKRAQQMLLNVQTRAELNEFRFHFLTSLLRLRQICCHPALYAPENRKAESAKLNAFTELVEPLMEEGHKVLVFSQFVSMLHLLREIVQEKGWPYFYLAGETEERGKLVEDFQAASGPALFLISLKAGGFGLNLTAASYVVLFDPWWNPAVENQAIDRTHRIGQKSKVIAYRLLTKGSIEEKIRALQRTKSALVADVLGEDSFAGSLTLEDLRFLFADDPVL